VRTAYPGGKVAEGSASHNPVLTLMYEKEMPEKAFQHASQSFQENRWANIRLR